MLHVDRCFPVQSHQPIRRLMLSQSSNNFGVIVNNILQDSPTKNLGITVAVKAAGNGASRSLEEMQSSQDVIRAE
jgi:hypothetical protein